MIDILPAEGTTQRGYTVLFETFEAIGVLAGKGDGMHEELETAWALAVTFVYESLEIF